MIPALCVAVFYSFVARAAISLGRWPRPYDPDPADLDFGIHDGFAMFALIFGLLSPCLMIAAAFVPKMLIREWRATLVGATLVLLTQIAFRLWFAVDPGMFIYWFFD